MILSIAIKNGPFLNKIKCVQCEYETPRAIEMRKHKKKFCTGRDILKCDECEYVSQRAAEMRKHKRFCHGNEVLKCDNCEYESQRALDMRKHKKFCLESEVKVKWEQIIQL